MPQFSCTTTVDPLNNGESASAVREKKILGIRIIYTDEEGDAVVAVFL